MSKIHSKSHTHHDGRAAERQTSSARQVCPDEFRWTGRSLPQIGQWSGTGRVKVVGGRGDSRPELGRERLASLLDKLAAPGAFAKVDSDKNGRISLAELRALAGNRKADPSLRKLAVLLQQPEGRGQRLLQRLSKDDESGFKASDISRVVAELRPGQRQPIATIPEASLPPPQPEQATPQASVLSPVPATNPLT